MRRIDVAERAAAVLLLLLAAALRAYRLGDADLWWDEALAVWAVRKPLLETTAWTAADVHPPLFFWLLWGWRHLLGEGEAALRALVALQGVLLAALAYALGRRAGGRAGGAWALALAATSPFLVWWSQELRMYTTAALALAAAAYAACRWADDPRSPAGRRALAAYVAAATATLHAVYLAGAGLAVLAVGAAVAAARRSGPRAVRSWAAANAVALLLFVPWALYAGSRMSSWRTVAEGASPGFVFELWAALLAHGTSTDVAGARLATAAWWLAAALAAGLAWKARGLRTARSGPPTTAAAMLAAFLIVPPALVWAATQPRSLFYSPSIEARYFVPFAVPVYALVGAWLGRAMQTGASDASSARSPWRLRAGLAAGLGLLALGAAFLPGHFGPRRRTAALDAMAVAIWSQAEPGDVVLLVSGNRYPLFLYHYERRWVQPAFRPRFEHPAGAPPVAADRPRVVPFPDRGSEPLPDGWERDLDRLVEGHARVWLVAYGRDLQDPGGQVEAWLAERFHRVLSEGYGPDALHLFAREDRPPVVTALSSRWPGALWLGRVHDALGATGTWLPLGVVPTRRAAAGDALEIVLFSTGDQRPARQRARLEAWIGPREPVVVRVGSPFPSEGADDAPEAPAGDEGERSAPSGAGDGHLAPPGAVLRHRFTVPIEARTPGGPMVLTLADGPALGSAPGIPVEVLGARPPVRGRAFEANAVVAGRVLVASRVASDRLWPGQALVLDLVWAPLAIEPLPAPGATVFAHLVGPGADGSGAALATGDGPPSTGAWDAGGARLLDRHVLPIPHGAPPGRYAIEVGLYDAVSGERYPVEGSRYVADAAGRRLLIGTVEVR